MCGHILILFTAFAILVYIRRTSMSWMEFLIITFLLTSMLYDLGATENHMPFHKICLDYVFQKNTLEVPINFWNNIYSHMGEHIPMFDKFKKAAGINSSIMLEVEAEWEV